ncbi:protein-disulfide reductase DsbD [Maribrevibacterium harenarium]|uniref:Protein-disulfide reductase DsbD n=1 Tax=Maribrevibacterium harenarium TaxID=2589817 RepID=A0A501X240_9GAMM|nr:protein-disulfide reductase DsbD [Maribrevibacterium harenarium]TPE54546.1 protein-disulfide reductase DsbD [Maribrevibacterium harenarium]
MKPILLLLSLLVPLSALGFSFGNNSKPEFLPVEQAFILGVRQSDKPGTINATWQITEGYYLYKHQFKLTTDGDIPVQFQDLPAGKKKNDPYFGEVEVYRRELTLPIRYPATNTTPQELNFILQYQGCADAGLCYPPQKVPVSITIPAASLTSTTSAQPIPIQDTTTSVSSTLANGSLWQTIGIMFGLGLLLTFTPCVLPMIPIVSAIVIGGKQKGWQGLGTTAIYVLGMASTYALIGALAAWFGTQFNLQAALQKPSLITASALLFTVLGLAMLGVFNLRLPSGLQQKLEVLSDQSRSSSSRFLGTFLAGVFATLIVSPCVSAPLAGAVLYISTTADIALGAFALFVMGLGMGVPLLVVGAMGSRILPRNGVWMEDVKALMGFAMLGMTVWLLARLLPGGQALYLWGAWLGLLAAYAFHTARRGESQYWRWLLGIMLVLLAALQWLGAASGNSNFLIPLTQNSTLSIGNEGKSQNRANYQFNIGSLAEMNDILATTKVPVMFDLYADWCISCQEIEHKILAAKEVTPLLNKITLVRIDVTDNSAENQALMQQYRLFGPPALLFFNDKGEYQQDWSLIGEPTKEEVVSRLSALLTLNQS